MKPLVFLLLLLLFIPASGHIQSGLEVHLRNVRQLTFGGVHSSPTISDDGRFLVFAARDSPHAAAHYGHECKQLYALELERANATPRLVSNRFGTFESAAFLPAGHSLVVASNLRNFEPLERRTPAETCGGWAADGVEERADGNFDLFELPLERAHRPVPLTRNARPLSALQVAASARRQVAFVGAEAAGRRLWLLNATSTLERTPVAEQFEAVSSPAFSPDGEKLAFYGEPTDVAGNSTEKNGGIFVVSLGNTAHVRRATPAGVQVADVCFHSNGQRLFVSDRRNLFLVDVGWQSMEQITFMGSNSAPLMSPDGRLLVWTSTRNSEDVEANLFVAEWVEVAQTRHQWFKDLINLFSRPRDW
ncbi:Dipeptidyl-peptidase 5 [Aphelenchoides fujianensis]|nr:Dipeptidyl-peptidase 5 [Aphelenchoides fujianensis]